MKIRELHANTHQTPSQIIKHLNLTCSDSAVYAIIVGRTYKTPRQNINSKAKLNSQDVKRIRGLLKLGKSREWVAVEYGVSFSTIQRIHLGYIWKGRME